MEGQTGEQLLDFEVEAVVLVSYGPFRLQKVENGTETAAAVGQQ